MELILSTTLIFFSKQFLCHTCTFRHHCHILISIPITFLHQKFREYTLSCNRLARLQSKFSAIQKALGDNQSVGPANRSVEEHGFGLVLKGVLLPSLFIFSCFFLFCCLLLQRFLLCFFDSSLGFFSLSSAAVVFCFNASQLCSPDYPSFLFSPAPFVGVFL